MKQQTVKQQIIFFAIAILTMAGAVMFGLNNKITDLGINDMSGTSYEKGCILEVKEEELNENGEGFVRGVQMVEAEILSGMHKGKTVEIKNQMAYEHSIYVTEGERVILCIGQANADSDSISVTIYTYDRISAILFIVGAFVLLLVLLGGKTGARSVFGLVYTFVMILFLLIPLLLKGYPPVPVSVAVIVLVAAVSLISLLGFTKKTLCAVIGVSAGTILCCVLFFCTSTLLRVNGYNLDEVDTLALLAQVLEFRIRDLLFVGVLIASLGAVMDVAVSVSTSVCELREMNPAAAREELLRSGIRIGRDITGTMANTLILAFAGAFFTTLFLCNIYGVSMNQLLNMDAIAIEIAQALSATMALALAALLTAIAASWIFTEKREKNQVS